MPRRKLTINEQAFVNEWVPRMFYFMKMMRRADRYIATIPRELYSAAYKEVCNSGFVAGGEWRQKPDPNDKSCWEPKRKDRRAYLDYMEGIIKQHPLVSAFNAVMVFFASNGGSMCITKTIVIDQSERVQDEFWDGVHKLNDVDLEEMIKFEGRSNPSLLNPLQVIDRDPNERPLNMPFVRLKRVPDNIKISRRNWPQFELVGQTFFVKDDGDETGYTAFELAGILLLQTGKFYRIRYEDNVDSLQITEDEMFDMFKDGMWV